MATTVFRGFFEDLVAGNLDGNPDIRCVAVMSGFTGDTEEEAQTLAGITAVDEWDALGYAEYDPADATFSYDAASHRMYLDFTNGAGDEWGTLVSAGSEVVQGMMIKRYVDGGSGDIPLLYTDSGFGLNAAGAPVGLTLPALGIAFIAAA
jgi:hypothetical protein